MTSKEVDHAWVLLKDVIWEGGLESMLGNNETIWLEYGRRRGLGNTLFPML